MGILDAPGIPNSPAARTALAQSPEVKALLAPRTVYRPEGLRRFAASLADSRTSRTNILGIGDSTLFGIGADGTQTTTDATGAGVNGPDQLRKRFNAWLGNSVDSGQLVLPSDSRCVRTNANVSTSTGAYGSTSYRVDGAGSQIVFPALRCTSIDIILDWHPSASGQFSYSVDGGADVTPAAGSGTASGTIYVRTVTGLDPATAHSITIKAPTDTSKRAIIIGLRYRTETGVSVMRVGRPGATSLDVIQGSGTMMVGGEYRRLLMLCSINAFEPDLMIIKLGINDLGLPGNGQAQTVQPAAYKANLKQIAQYVTDPATAADTEFNGSTKAPLRRTVGGSVLLVVGPRAATVGTTPESQYWQAAREVCDEMDHVSMINLADWYGSFAEAHDPAMNLQLPGSVHSTSRGYGRDADIIFSALTSAQVLGVQ